MDIAALLPHGPSMILIDQVRESSGTQAVLSVDVDAVRQWCWRRDGAPWIPPWIAIELFAQAAAIGRAAAGDGNVRPIARGVIVRVQRMQLGRSIEPQAQLSVSVAWTEAISGALEVDGRLFCDGQDELPVVAGRLLLKEMAAV
jgi:predicted hotdog family 3-hydroxylacyl-ACP dehydratase